MPQSPGTPALCAQMAHTIPVTRKSLDLGITLDNGQVFHWKQDETGVWHGLIDTEGCKIYQDTAGIHTDADPVLVSNYLALDDPLKKIEMSFPKGDYCRAALAACRGMRIIRQPFWECLASFICSSMKQVAHIRQIITELRTRYGQPVKGSAVYAFPSAEVLAGVSERELRDCRLGYRAKSLRGTALCVAGGMLPMEELETMPTDEVRALLTKLPGVGPKIANCVLLFSLHRLDAVPVDVWIHRILEGLAGHKLSQRQAGEAAKNLGPYAGYVQQYLFHHARVGKNLPAPRSS